MDSLKQMKSIVNMKTFCKYYMIEYAFSAFTMIMSIAAVKAVNKLSSDKKYVKCAL